MAIDLQSFASGDTDYISKLNQNFDALKAAIDLLQLQASSSGTPAASVGLFFDSLFNGEDCLIGAQSYVPTPVGATLTIATGGMYLASTQLVVVSLLPVDINFAGQTANNYYITVDSGGTPTRTASQEVGSAWLVEWDGAAFVGDPVRVANCFYDAEEATASRVSTAQGDPGDPLASPPVAAEAQSYTTLDDRLEAIEETVGETQDIVATVTANRKIGCTVDGTTGVKGAIQIDFAGTIVGWSIIADQVGEIEIDVSRISNSPPDEAPLIPDPDADKISASAPIAILASSPPAQSAAEDEDGVSTWDTELLQWDTIQFRVVSVTDIEQATLYLRIAQTFEE